MKSPNSNRSSRGKSPRRRDVLIVGGGIMGCASAFKLASAGLEVTVLERSVPGAEASSAAAGILGARVEAHHAGPLAELCVKSAELYPGFAKALARHTAIDVEYRRSGVLRVAFRPSEGRKLERASRFQRDHAVMLSRRELAKLEPALSTKLWGGIHYESDARIDPKRLLAALHVAAQRAGAEFRSGAYVKRVVCDGDEARGVALDDGSELRARFVVVAAGSWTTLIEGSGLESRKVVPARGQILELRANRPLLERVVFGPGAYLVPRDDGRVLVGSTLEFVGYQRDVTAEAARSLLARAIALVPELASASLAGAWSNFRPYTADELPLIGRTRVSGLLLATGHYRNGILLAPVTAEIVAALVLGKKPPVDLAPFDPGR